MVVLVLGAAGQLGQAIQSIASQFSNIKFVYATSSTADITKKEDLTRVFADSSPDFCINAAAYTAVDKSENELDQAKAINVIGVENVAAICNEFNTTLIHISTDFVFDGQKATPYTEEDQTNPQGVYGLTKRMGEEVIVGKSEKYYIIRTAWLYSDFGNNFMKTMIRLAKEREVLNVVNDQIGTPTHAIDLAHAVIKIIESDKTDYGIYHFSNEGTASWHEFAARIFELNGIKIQLNAISTSEFPTPAKRPKYSVLDKSKIKHVFGVDIKSWQDSLKSHLKSA